jgi:hypothetical protein
MTQHDPDWDDPPEPAKPLEYRRPPDPWERAPARRAFGNTWGNVAVGFCVFLASCFIGPYLAKAVGATSGWAYTALPITTLAVGLVAALNPRYRGVFLGMLLIVIGVPLLILGICYLK